MEKTHVEINFQRPSIDTFVHQLYKHAARQSWSSAYLFKTVGVTSEQQARNRRDIETMIGGAMNEVIDSFIPWKDISKAYFQSENAPPAPVPEPEPVKEEPEIKPALVEVPEPKAVQFDADEEDDEPPPLTLGDDIQLDDSEFDTEDDESVNLEPSETVSLNL
jgi:hypothetical protein